MLPPAHADLAVAHVDGDDEPVSKRLDVRLGALLEGGSADDDPRSAGAEERERVRRRS